MRPAVPMLNDQLTADEFLQMIATNFQSVIFGTVDANGDPFTNVADIELCVDGQLIFATTYQKAFYQRLKITQEFRLRLCEGTKPWRVSALP